MWKARGSTLKKSGKMTVIRGGGFKKQEKKKKEKGKKRKKRKREICEADGHCSVKNGAMMEAGRWNILRRLFCYFFTPRLMSVKCASR